MKISRLTFSATVVLTTLCFGIAVLGQDEPVSPDTPIQTTTEEFFKFDDDFFNEEFTSAPDPPSIPEPETTVSSSIKTASEASSVPQAEVTESTFEEPNINENLVANYTPAMGYKMADKLSDQIRLFLKHFQQENPVGIPGAVLPDPMPLPDMRKSIGIGTVTFSNIKLYELSQFRLSHINTDLEKMQVYVEIEMKRLITLGNYSMRSWVNKANGPFNITMLDVVAEGAAALERDENGQLEATDSNMDMSCKKIIIDLKNSGMAPLVEGLGAFMFENIKPTLLRKLNTDIRNDINKQIKSFTAKIPKEMSPLDLGIYEARRYVRNNNYDPFQLKNYSYKVNMARINISDFWLEGLSNFNRVGDLSLSMDKGIIQFGIHIITSKLKGYLNWAVMFSNKHYVTESGLLTYEIENLQVKISVNQSMNIRQKPQLNDLDLRLGKLKIKHKGLNQLDFVIENIINSYLPEIFKLIITDAIEEGLKYKIQHVLNHTLVDENSVDKLLENKILPKLDDYVEKYKINMTPAPNKTKTE